MVPDPIIKEVQHFVVPSEDGKHESVVFRLIPRPGQTVFDLSFTVLEQRANLLSKFQTIPVLSDGLITIPSSTRVQMSGYIVAHPIHGVLAYQVPVPFMRPLQLLVDVSGRHVTIQSPESESPRSNIETYEVTELSEERSVTVGNPRRSANTRVLEAETRRGVKAEASRYDQTWFDDGQRSAARAFVRSRISKARHFVIVADPYFGARQVAQFLHAVLRTNIAFTILTSRLAFEGEQTQQTETPETTAATMGSTHSGSEAASRRNTNVSEMTRLDDFTRMMQTLEQRGILNATAFVLGGKTPRLHDRFLVVDDLVWFLGNSLNALGDRASLILRVPDGESIVQRLREMEAEDLTFAAYADGRRKALSSRGEGA